MWKNNYLIIIELQLNYFLHSHNNQYNQKKTPAFADVLIVNLKR